VTIGRILSRLVLVAAGAAAAWTQPPPAVLSDGPLRLDPDRERVMVHRGPPPRDASTWRALDSGAFEPVRGGRLWFGWNPGMVLLRIVVRAPAAGRWWIQVHNVSVDSLRAECGGRSGGWSGDAVPRGEGGAPWHGYALPVDLRGGLDTIHLEIRKSRRLGMALVLRPEALQQRLVEDDAVRDGLIGGVLLANLILAVWLFAVARDKLHLWYILYQALALSFFLGVLHHDVGWLWAHTPWSASILPRILGLSASTIAIYATAARFMLRLLRLEEARPFAGRALRRLSNLLYLAVAVQCLFLPFTTAVSDFLYLHCRMEILESLCWLLIAGLVVDGALRGDRMARNVLLAMGPMAGALLFYQSAEFLHLSVSYQYRGIVAGIGLAVENLGLSVLLVFRHLDERRAHRKLLEGNLALERDFSRNLALEIDRNLREASLDLEGTVGQDLTGLGLRIRAALREAGREDLLEVFSGDMGRIQDAVRASAERIYPPELGQGGLRASLDLLARRIRSGGEVSIVVSGDMPGLVEEQALHWFRIAQEAVSNALRHGGAKRIELELGDASLEVRDDGSGMVADPVEGLGMKGIRQRASLLGCSATLLCRPGTGCRLAVGRTGIALDARRALDFHEAWKERFLQAIAGKGSASLESAGDPTVCDLGQWLAGEGLLRHGRSPGHAICRDAHRRFHEAAGEVAREIAAGRLEKARALLGDFTPYSAASSALAAAILHLERETIRPE
jgi:signal transduction histidine kinase